MVQFRKDRPSPWMVQIRDAYGKIKTHSFERKEDALEFESKERRNRKLTKAGLVAPREEILFYDRVKSYLRKVKSKNAFSSYKQDESRFRNYWLEKFGKRPIASITTAEIKEHLDYIQIELEHTPSDRNRHRALLHSFFQDAFMDDKVLANPVSKIQLEDEVKRVKHGQIKSYKDWDKYVQAMYEQGAEFGVWAEIMGWTGARIMTAAALQYQDIDAARGTVVLRRLIERASGRVVERTKGAGEGGSDIVPLFPRLKHAINGRRQSSNFIRPTDFVVCDERGEVLTYEKFRTAHDRALESAKVDRFTPHAVRKFFATNAKRAGYTRAEIRELLGHSSEAVTARYDFKDIDHLVMKGKKLKFGMSVSSLSAKRDGLTGQKRRKRA